MGDLGPAAYEFIDFLAETGQQLWQVLPLGPTGHGNSPYMSYSSMAGNHMLISLEQLRDRGLLKPSDLDEFPYFSDDEVDYSGVLPEKLKLLEKAAETFNAAADEETRAEYEAFCKEHAFWLDDYAFFYGAETSPWRGQLAPMGKCPGPARRSGYVSVA